jgi:hypothetical protein
MPRFDSFRSVISLWDSPDDMAADIGATGMAVRKWGQRDRIPDEWWNSILKTSAARGAGLTAARLVALASREPAEARA